MKKQKEEIVEKDPVIQIAEKQERGIVKIEFEDELAPLQPIKTNKKSRHKSQEQENQEEKAQIPEIIHKTSYKVQKEEVSIEQLEMQIKEQMNLLELKKAEERAKLEEQKRILEEEKRLLEEEEQKAKLEEEQRLLEEKIKILEEERKQEELIKAQEIHKIRLMPDDDNFLSNCPLCKSKIKKSKVKKQGVILTQSFKCKNKACNFFKELKFII